MDRFAARFDFSQTERESLITNIQRFYDMKHPKNYKKMFQEEEEKEEEEEGQEDYGIASVSLG
jgi:hypothetical protein